MISKVIVLTGIIMLPILLLFAYFVYRTVKRNKEDQHLELMISRSLDYSYYESGGKRKLDFDTKFIEFWRDRLKPSGLVSPISDDKQNAVKLIMVCLGIFLTAFLFSFNLILSIIPVAMFLGGLLIYCQVKINAFEKMLNEQIPSFLSALKSNVQSNETPETALVGAINNTADPLYSELKIVKSLIETGTFETALSALRRRTKNEYLIFLCSCIELSSEVGSNLQDQIEIIENMIKNRQKLTKKTDSAVSENMPILYVTAVAVPFVFIYMYMIDESVRNFWFKSLLSWVLFGLIFVIIGAGTYIGYKVIQSVRKM